MNVIKTFALATIIAAAFVTVQPVAMPTLIDTAAQASCDVQVGRRNSCHQGYLNSCAGLGRNNPWCLNGGNGGYRNGGQMRPMRPVYNARPVYRGQQHAHRTHHMARSDGGSAIVNGGGHVKYVVSGKANNIIELQRGPNYAASQTVALTAGATRPSIKSPYQNIGSKEGVTYFLVDVD